MMRARFLMLIAALSTLNGCALTHGADTASPTLPVDTAPRPHSQTRALLDRAVPLYQAGQYAEALPLFQAADAQGDMKAPRYLGLMALDGHGLGPEPVLAFGYFQRAAERGDITGQYWLAHCYEQGIGTGKDVQQALRWYQRSAERGDKIAAPAMTALGRFHEDGIAVPVDLQAALRYYRLAAATGNTDAQEALTSLRSRLRR